MKIRKQVGVPAVQSSNEHSHYLCGGDTCTKVGHDEENSETTFGAWSSTTELPSEAGNYYLTKNVTLSEKWESVNGVVLCLNGKTITMKDSGAVINMSATDKSLTLTDCAPEGEVGKVTHIDNKAGSGVSVANNSTFTLYGGSITGNNMGTGNGGSITGNNAGYDGGGVFVESGTFTMSGGSINGNNANNGGGVYVNIPNTGAAGTFTMSGGSINGNNAAHSYNDGGGVYVKGTFKLKDGSITGNYVGGTRDSNTGVYEKGENGKDNNVYLPAGKTIDASGLGDTGGTIGVTTADAPTANSPVKIATGAKESVDYTDIFKPDVTDKGYTITSDSHNVCLSAHKHSWTYALENDKKDTITATCKGCVANGNVDYNGGSVTIKAPDAGNLTYNGSAKAATVTASSDWQGGTVTDITYKQGETTLNDIPKNAGAYTASIKLGDAEASVTYEIKKADLKASDFTFTAPTSLTYDGSDKTAKVEANSGITGMGNVTVKYYKKHTENYYEEIQNARAVKNAGTYLVKINVAAGDNYNAATDLTADSWTFTIAKADYTGEAISINKSVLWMQSYQSEAVDMTEYLPEIDGAKISNPKVGIGSDDIIEKVEAKIDTNTVEIGMNEKVAVDKKATINVTITSTNYNDITATINVSTRGKDVATVEISGLLETVTYGQEFTLTPKAKDGETVLTGGTWSWDYGSEYFKLVESNANTGTIKLQAIKAGGSGINVNYSSGTHSGSEYKFVTIQSKTLTKDDLEGIPTSLTKVYDGGTGYTYPTGTAIALTLKEAAQVLDSDRNMRISISASQITFDNSNAGTTTATISLTEASEILARMNDNYQFASDFTSITVPAEITKATPTVSGTGTATGTYGQKLSEVTVNGLNATLNGETVAGSWALKGAENATLDEVNPSGSTSEYTAVFTPKDTNNYNTVEKTVDVTVNPKAGGSLGTVNLTQKYTDTAEKKYEPNWTGLPEGETWSYNGNMATSSNSITLDKNDFNADGTTLTYSIFGGQAGDKVTFTLTATCSSGHYTPFTITVVVQLGEKDPQTGFKFEKNSKTVTYGDADFTVQATGAETGSTVTYASSKTYVATVDQDGTVTIIGAGTAKISATASETTDYAEKTVSYTLTVNKKQITAPTADSTTFTYNGTAQTYKLAENEAYAITGNKQTNANENGYRITVSLNDKDNTEWADNTTDDKTYSFVIKKATVTITAKNQSAYVGKTAPTLGEDSYTVSGLFGEDTLTKKPEIKYVDAEGNEVTPDMTKIGETIIRVSGAAASENYTISYIDGTLTVSAASSGGGSTIQKPTIITDNGAEAKFSYSGRTLTIAVKEGYEITDVLVNGISKGKVTEVTDLRTGDKVEVKTAKKAEPTEPVADNNAKLIKGVENTTIILKSKLTKAGKVLLTWTKSKGYKVDYFEVYRSVKKNSGYGKKPFFTTKDGNWSKYMNTKELKAGKTYYYKVRGVRVIDGKKYYTKYSNKAWRTIK